MARLGWYLLLFGAGSALLHFFDNEFVMLMWIDSWGDAVGWALRISMVIAGGLLAAAAREPAPERAAEGNPLLR